jgi:hypothetical protein
MCLAVRDKSFDEESPGAWESRRRGDPSASVAGTAPCVPHQNLDSHTLAKPNAIFDYQR